MGESIQVSDIECNKWKLKKEILFSIFEPIIAWYLTAILLCWTSNVSLRVPADPGQGVYVNIEIRQETSWNSVQA